MNFDKKNLSNKTLVKLYKELLKTRLIEQRMLLLLRQGKISKWFSGIGQEAISIGATCALEEDAYLLPAHRNLGVFTARGISTKALVAQFQGKESGFTKGRDRSFHFGSKAHYIVGMISHLSAQLPVAAGIALGQKLKNQQKATLTFLGEGATSEGDFHESLNLAAVWDLPVIFLVENNAYAISTPTEEQFKINSFTEKALAYGIEAIEIDGNNVIEVYNTIRRASAKVARFNRPILIEAKTFRMRGHEESANNDFVPEKLLEKWAKKDPLFTFENFLLKENVIDKISVAEWYQELEQEIKQEALQADQEEGIAADFSRELEAVYANYQPKNRLPDTSQSTKMRLVDAINHTLDLNLQVHPNLLLMGQDIAAFGGVFKVTQGLVEKFGKDRVRNTPLCESAVIGAGLGLSIVGYKTVIEMQFADFVTCGFNQIVNNLAKSHYRWGQTADVVIRMPTGAGTGAGPYHSQSTEAWFYRVPGLKIVYPSNPIAAKGLLSAAIEDPNPVLYFEHKLMYRSIEADVPLNHYTIEIGKAAIAQAGEAVSIITYGMGVHWALEISKLFDTQVEIIDLQTLLPWDKEAVKTSVAKTGKVLLLTEDTQQGNILNDIAAYICQECFKNLDAPIKIVASLDTPIPFTKELEGDFLAKSRLQQALAELINY
jgi:2-oxoisovalerate dehydrogenase E1 component